jgi:hypothetical protein
MRCSGRRCAMPTSDRVNGVTPAGLAREPTRIWPLSKGYPLQAVALARRSCDATVGCGRRLEAGGRDHLGLGARGRPQPALRGADRRNWRRGEGFEPPLRSPVKRVRDALP